MGRVGARPGELTGPPGLHGAGAPQQHLGVEGAWGAWRRRGAGLGGGAWIPRVTRTRPGPPSDPFCIALFQCLRHAVSAHSGRF